MRVSSIGKAEGDQPQLSISRTPEQTLESLNELSPGFTSSAESLIGMGPSAQKSFAFTNLLTRHIMG
ncbi:MAG: hypothetical protein Q9216_002803 [Gyalolechia sp. 2 TL-2023]